MPIRVLYIKGKGEEFWREWALCVRAIGHMALGQLVPCDLRKK
jgi:hypothetical protein